jgi:hypothetical protein
VGSAVCKQIYKFSPKYLLQQFDKRKPFKIKMLQKELLSINHHRLQSTCREKQKMEIIIRVKVKVNIEQATKAQRGSRVITRLFL